MLGLWTASIVSVRILHWSLLHESFTDKTPLISVVESRRSKAVGFTDVGGKNILADELKMKVRFCHPRDQLFPIGTCET